jgi:carboxylesterase
VQGTGWVQCVFFWAVPDRRKDKELMKKPLGALIIHGFSGAPEELRRIAPPLQALGIPCLTPTLTGHGTESPEALNGMDWTAWVEDGRTALNTILQEVEKVIVIGHSMGGWIALSLAIDYREEVDSIVIAGASTRSVSLLGPNRPLHFLFPLLVNLKKRWDFSIELADPAYDEGVHGYEWVPMKSWITVFDFMRATEERLPQVSVPILIMHSRNDKTNAPNGVKILDERISTPRDQKRIVWFERTSHDMFNDCERDKVIATVVGYAQERMETL